ncbi:MAG: hypothetical protein ACRCXZ_07045 [Patescibacteria group bacterium]
MAEKINKNKKNEKAKLKRNIVEGLSKAAGSLAHETGSNIPENPNNRYIIDTTKLPTNNGFWSEVKNIKSKLVSRFGGSRVDKDTKEKTASYAVVEANLKLLDRDLNKLAGEYVELLDEFYNGNLLQSDLDKVSDEIRYRISVLAQRNETIGEDDLNAGLSYVDRVLSVGYSTIESKNKDLSLTLSMVKDETYLESAKTAATNLDATLKTSLAFGLSKALVGLTGIIGAVPGAMWDAQMKAVIGQEASEKNIDRKAENRKIKVDEELAYYEKSLGDLNSEGGAIAIYQLAYSNAIANPSDQELKQKLQIAKEYAQKQIESMLLKHSEFEALIVKGGRSMRFSPIGFEKWQKSIEIFEETLFNAQQLDLVETSDLVFDRNGYLSIRETAEKAKTNLENEYGIEFKDPVFESINQSKVDHIVQEQDLAKKQSKKEHFSLKKRGLTAVLSLTSSVMAIGSRGLRNIVNSESFEGVKKVGVTLDSTVTKEVKTLTKPYMELQQYVEASANKEFYNSMYPDWMQKLGQKLGLKGDFIQSNKVSEFIADKYAQMSMNDQASRILQLGSDVQNQINSVKPSVDKAFNAQFRQNLGLGGVGEVQNGPFQNIAGEYVASRNFDFNSKGRLSEVIKGVGDLYSKVGGFGSILVSLSSIVGKRFTSKQTKDKAKINANYNQLTEDNTKNVSGQEENESESTSFDNTNDLNEPTQESKGIDDPSAEVISVNQNEQSENSGGSEDDGLTQEPINTDLENLKSNPSQNIFSYEVTDYDSNQMLDLIADNTIECDFKLFEHTFDKYPPIKRVLLNRREFFYSNTFKEKDSDREYAFQYSIVDGVLFPVLVYLSQSAGSWGLNVPNAGYVNMDALGKSKNYAHGNRINPIAAQVLEQMNPKELEVGEFTQDFYRSTGFNKTTLLDEPSLNEELLTQFVDTNSSYQDQLLKENNNTALLSSNYSEYGSFNTDLFKKHLDYNLLKSEIKNYNGPQVDFANELESYSTTHPILGKLEIKRYKASVADQDGKPNEFTIELAVPMPGINGDVLPFVYRTFRSIDDINDFGLFNEDIELGLLTLKPTEYSDQVPSNLVGSVFPYITSDYVDLRYLFQESKMIQDFKKII